MRRSAVNNARVDWYEQNGLPDTTDSTPAAYARRLVRYIADASTVRVRVIEEHGWSPPVEKIRVWREDWLALVASRHGRPWANDPDELEEPANDDALDVDEICASIAARLVEVGADGFDDLQPDPPAPPAPVFTADILRPISRIARNHREVIEDCATICGVSAEDIVGKSRCRRLVLPRQFTATVLRARRNSYPQVGRYLGDRDHSTAVHSVRTFFDKGMREPGMCEAWMRMAPCAAKFVRSIDELDAMLGTKVGMPPQ